MALQTQTGVALDEELGIDRAVRLMASHASFPQCLMFVQDRFGLLAMAVGAGLVEPRHRQRSRRLHDVAPMRIVALHAVHLTFDHRMVIGEMELGVDLDVALKAIRWVRARIHDEHASPPARGDVFARGAVARFASGNASMNWVCFVEARMDAAGERLDDVPVAIDAGLVPGKHRSLDQWRGDDGAFDRRASGDPEQQSADSCHGEPPG